MPARVTTSSSAVPTTTISTAVEGDDTVVGVAGHDTISGGTGRDFLVGGSGEDDVMIAVDRVTLHAGGHGGGGHGDEASHGDEHGEDGPLFWENEIDKVNAGDDFDICLFGAGDELANCEYSSNQSRPDEHAGAVHKGGPCPRAHPFDEFCTFGQGLRHS